MELAIGFDPAFIDTLVRLESIDGELLDTLPPLGHHHRKTKILRVAGGNGVNISSTLLKLGVDHKLVIPLNDLFSSLLAMRGIKNNVVPISAEISETVALTMSGGELQLNEIKGKLQFKHWTQEVHQAWINSPIRLFLNWGLNQTSVEWVAIQWLASCDWSYDRIINEKDLYNAALQTEYMVYLNPSVYLHFYPVIYRECILWKKRYLNFVMIAWPADSRNTQ